MVNISSVKQYRVAIMKVAIIGCGKIANSAHIPSYLKNKHANKYFCDIIPERAVAAVENTAAG